MRHIMYIVLHSKANVNTVIPACTFSVKFMRPKSRLDRRQLRMINRLGYSRIAQIDRMQFHGMDYIARNVTLAPSSQNNGDRNQTSSQPAVSRTIRVKTGPMAAISSTGTIVAGVATV
jgi:hypothetical protein